MKKIVLFIGIIGLCFSVFSQQQTITMTWDGVQRQYIEYVPAIYNPSNAAPVIFCLHGLGDNMTNFSNIGYHQLANQKGWIVITPQALMASILGNEIGTAWNSGAGADVPYLGLTILNEDVDDPGFLIAILDSLENHYNINTDSVFFMGFSMGGFMCHRMAIEHGSRINAIASVSGTIGSTIQFEPIANLNVLHIHGTADTQVTYENAGFNTGMGVYSVGTGAEQTVNLWKTYNNCNSDPIVTLFPNTVADGKTFERYLYTDGDNETYTAFLKVIGGDHEWYYTPQNDIDYRMEIYKFFTNSMDFPSNIDVINNDLVKLYPNPANNVLFVETDIIENSSLSLFDVTGKKIYNIENIAGLNTLDVSNLPEGMYFIRISNSEKSLDRKIIISR